MIHLDSKNMSDSTMQEALAAKARGNQALAAKNYQAAIDEYSKAIELDPTKAVFYSNRCAAYLQASQIPDNLNKALEDAETCIDKKRDWAKGYALKGSVLYRQNEFKQAIVAYQEAIEFSPEQTNAEYTAAIESITRHPFFANAFNLN